MSVGRATGSTKARLRSMQRRWPLPVLVSETGVDPDAYGIRREDADQGTEMLLAIHGRGARQMAERLQSTHGSSWEDDGPTLAYNMVVVWGDQERKAVIDELHKDGVALAFEDETPPGLRERILRRRSRLPVKYRALHSSKNRWSDYRYVRVGPGERCVRHADCRANPALGRKCCEETRKTERAQLARRKAPKAPKGRVYGTTDDARALAIRAGAKEPLEHLGTGATGEVFADARGLAYKVPRSAPSALTIAEEAEWLRVASQVPFVRDHVARFHHYDRETGVLVRENVQGLHRSEVPWRRPASRLDTWNLHKEIERLMRPYGLGRPEYKEESYRLVRGRGWVLFDAGFSLLYGRKLIAYISKVSRYGPEGWDTAFAIVQEIDKTIPRPIAVRALRNLAARSTSAREYLQHNWPEYLA